MRLLSACVLIALVMVALIVQDYPESPLYEGPSPFIIKTLPTPQHVTIQTPHFVPEVGLPDHRTDDSTTLGSRHRTTCVVGQIVCMTLPLLI